MPELPSTVPGQSEHPWMEHEITGHRAQLPDIDYWRANGWHPVDGPAPEVDRTKDPDLTEPSTEDGVTEVPAKTTKTKAKGA